jgi:hypothetical protein
MCGRYIAYADRSHLRERFRFDELREECLPRYRAARALRCAARAVGDEAA